MTTKSKSILKMGNGENLGNLPIWDLSDLYNSIESSKIVSDLKFIKKKSIEFAKNYENKTSLLNASSFLKAIEEFEIINERMDKILSFAHLLYAENIEDLKNKIFFQQIQEKLTKISTLLIFFTLEINQIEDKKINKFYNFVNLKKYKTWIEITRKYKPHQLDKELEKLMQDKSLTSSAAWIKLFDETITTLKFPFKKKRVSSTEILNYLSDKSASNRKQAAKSFGKVLKNNINIFSIITNTLAKDKAINDEWRKFPNPVRSRNLSNFVEDEVVDALAKVVTNSYSNTSHRYYKMKSKWFGKKIIKILG